MSRRLPKRARKKLPPADLSDTVPTPHYVHVKDVVGLLHDAAGHLEDALRLLAEATLLDPALDESLGIEAQRLIGVRAAVQGEMQSRQSRDCEKPKRQVAHDDR